MWGIGRQAASRRRLPITNKAPRSDGRRPELTESRPAGLRQRWARRRARPPSRAARPQRMPCRRAVTPHSRRPCAAQFADGRPAATFGPGRGEARARLLQRDVRGRTSWRSATTSDAVMGRRRRDQGFRRLRRCPSPIANNGEIQQILCLMRRIPATRSSSGRTPSRPRHPRFIVDVDARAAWRRRWTA